MRFWGIDSDLDRPRIQALRATPPGLAVSDPTTLGALWAANRQLESVDDLGGGYPPALDLNIIGSGDPSIPPTRARLTRELATGLPSDLGDAATELGRRLHDYPGAANGLVVTVQIGSAEVEVEWRDPNGEPLPINQIAPGVDGRPNSGGFLKPQLNQAGGTLPDLALWWATLLTLSSLARYHPEQWSDVLNRDKATTAIPIEEALNIGREILPWLLLAALSQ